MVKHMLINSLNKIIEKSYRKKTPKWYDLPINTKLGKYGLKIYAMNLDWESLRIKITKNHSNWKIIKKGLYE